MKPNSLSQIWLFLATVSVFFCLTSQTTLAKLPPRGGEKIKAEDVIAKHLEAIGPAAVRAEIKTRRAEGTASFWSLAVRDLRPSGPAVFTSEGKKVLLEMNFNLSDYQSERTTFDGKQVWSGYRRPGVRSPLSEYLLPRKVIFQEGLFGGVLSTGWSLLDLSSNKARLEYGGIKKVDGTPAHLLRYQPKGGSDVTIRLYFDTEHFRHIQTEYEQVFAAQMGATPEQSAQIQTPRIKMTERFDDFSEEQGLVLPHSYKILFSPNGSTQFNWQITFQKVVVNEPVDPSTFQLSPGK